MAKGEKKKTNAVQDALAGITDAIDNAVRSYKQLAAAYLANDNLSAASSAIEKAQKIERVWRGKL